MKLSELAADLELEEEGVWEPVQGDFEVRICSSSSKRALKAYRKYLRPYERRIAAGNLKDEDIVPMVAQYIAHGLLLDWRGAEDDDGNPIPFSPKVAAQALAAPEMRPVRRKIQNLAGEDDLFKRVQLEEDIDALKGESAGRSMQESSSPPAETSSSSE